MCLTVCPCDSEAIWLYLCAVKPQRAWFCEFCRFAAESEYYGIILQIITVSYHHIKFEPPVSRCFFFFFRGSDGPHCEALLSCCHSLSSSGMASSIEQCSHAMPDFRCCFSSCGITSASWFILDLLGTSQDLRDKAQRDDPWWSMM